MREPVHEKLAPLRASYAPDTGYLDTGPLSIVALWAPDSAHVAVLNRSDRHVLDLALFGVANGKVRPLEVPRLFDLVGRRHLEPHAQYTLFGRLYRFTWENSGRGLILEEWDDFAAHKRIFRTGLEGYLTLTRLGPERAFSDFSARAVCEITRKGELRTLSIKPLPLANWPKTIVYSPHLLFEQKLGLHDTETTMSSLNAQKNGK
jgi:hypothetical protein